MAELSSPLQVTGLIESNCASDPNIYSIYSFKSDDMGGNEYLGFAIFYSPENDMDNEWLRDVKLLWENGTITAAGQEFLDQEWKLHSMTEYRNNKDESIRVKYSPIGKNGEIIESLS